MSFCKGSRQGMLGQQSKLYRNVSGSKMNSRMSSRFSNQFSQGSSQMMSVLSNEELRGVLDKKVHLI